MGGQAVAPPPLSPKPVGGATFAAAEENVLGDDGLYLSAVTHTFALYIHTRMVAVVATALPMQDAVALPRAAPDRRQLVPPRAVGMCADGHVFRCLGGGVGGRYLAHPTRPRTEKARRAKAQRCPWHQKAAQRQKNDFSMWSSHQRCRPP